MLPKIISAVLPVLLLSLPALAGQDSATTAAASPLPNRQTVTVAELVREAKEKHPALAVAGRMLEASRARIPQARALPDPTVSLGWMGDPVPFKVMKGDPSAYRSVAAMQEFPLGGKRRLRGLMAEKSADATTFEVEDMARRITADVKSTFYDYFYFTKALEITATNRELLLKLSQIATARYQVGKAMQADVLRSHVELSRLQQKITTLQQQQRTAVARLNSLLLRSPDAPMPAPEAPQASELDQPLATLVSLAQQNDTELRRRKALWERNQAGILLARKEIVPDLGVGYMYQQRPGMEDMQGVTFTLNIPIFYKSKQKEMVKEAAAEAQAAELSIRDRETRLSFEVQEQYLMAKAAEDLLRLFSQGVVPQSSLALESSLSSYEVGATDFLTLMTNFLTVLDYETEYYRELANHKIALARLEPLVGVELTN